MNINYIKTLLRKKHRAFQNKLLGNLMGNEKKNPKDFWNTVNTLLKTNKGDASQDILRHMDRAF